MPVRVHLEEAVGVVNTTIVGGELALAPGRKH